MRSFKDAPKSEEKDFPKLMIEESAGTIVLFEKEGCGTVVWSINESLMGFYYTDWSMKKFMNYNGSVTIQND